MSGVKSAECQQIIQRINAAYAEYEVGKSMGASEHARALREATSLIPSLYIEYLDIRHCRYVGEGKRLDYSLGDAWEACFAKGNLVVNLLKIYSSEKGSFFVLLDSAAQRKIKSTRVREEILDSRMGMKPFTQLEEKTLSSLLRYAGENKSDLDFWCEEDYRGFCRTVGLDESTWQQVSQLYQTNQNIYAVRSSSGEDEEGELDRVELDWGRSNREARPVEEEIFGTQNSEGQEFHRILKTLDDKLYPILPKGKQRMWPDLFTVNYTDQHVRVCKDRIDQSEGGNLTFEKLFEIHFDFMDFQNIRDEYGYDKYQFMRDWIIEFILQHRKTLSLTELANKYYMCSLANLSKEKSTMNERIKKTLH